MSMRRDFGIFKQGNDNVIFIKFVYEKEMWSDKWPLDFHILQLSDDS